MTPTKKAFSFIVMLGVVSLFADITYEGARSIVGPYLALLGASGAIVGTAVGFAEFVGYGLRFLSGYVTEKTGKFWLITYLGYGINLIAVPCLAFASSWQLAVFLIILERFGKAVRVPARDAMLSYASKHTGRGLGFGLHESLDRTGALIGPLAIALVLFLKNDYAMGFLILAIPAALSLLALLVAQKTHPTPQEFEVPVRQLQTKGYSRSFWLYLIAVSLIGCGYADFALIAFHFQKTATISEVWIPLFYTFAMAIDGAAALLFGHLFDKNGMRVLICTIALAALFAPFVFFGHFSIALIGTLLWGLGLGVQNSVLRAVIPHLIPPQRRPSAYGLLNLCFGLFWFLGSSFMGYLYDHSLLSLVLFSILIQLFSIPILIKMKFRFSNK